MILMSIMLFFFPWKYFLVIIKPSEYARYNTGEQKGLDENKSIL